jgi:hypothetical protein
MCESALIFTNGFFPQGKRYSGLKLSAYLRLISRLRMYGSVPPLFFDVLKIRCRIKHTNITLRCSNDEFQRLRWSRGCVLASSTQVRGFKPSRSRRIFQGEKIPSTPSFGGEVKSAVPCRRFSACKRSRNIRWKSAFRQNSRLLFIAH